MRHTTPKTQLKNAEYTKIMIVTLAETTPVLEAASLREDLRRAGIEPCAWVINNSLTISDTQSSLLKLRAEHKLARIDAICTQYAKRIALIPIQDEKSIAVECLLVLAQQHREEFYSEIGY